jgi:alkanesulfonate monooxygenase SsuD/methylene tetrahydromethanopterin reductase-like flavin-dependent oxidoreductase (luciferase family)
MTEPRLHLVAVLRPAGPEEGTGRAADQAFTLHHLARVARTLERGLFDAVFVADRAGGPATLDPLTLLPALAMATEHLGLIAASPTAFVEPVHVARKFAPLDHLSGGRAGWYAATAGGDPEAAERAGRFVAAVTGLWDEWAGAGEGGFRFRGRPVIALDTAVPHLTARADAVFARPADADEARAIAADLRTRSASGRPKLFHKIQVVLGASREEAAAKSARLDAGRPRPMREAPDPSPLRLADTPQAVADVLEAWAQEGLCDGLALAIPPLTDCLDGIVEHLIPELRRRGLVREAYAGRTLRANLGLPEPAQERAPPAGARQG